MDTRLSITIGLCIEVIEMGDKKTILFIIMIVMAVIVTIYALDKVLNIIG